MLQLESNSSEQYQLSLPLSNEKKKDLIKDMEKLERTEIVQVRGNFVISKAENIDNRPEKAQANQRKQIMKSVINDRYVADNYYSFQDSDEILFEKDGTIAKMKQFDYKVHKFIRKPSKNKKSN